MVDINIEEIIQKGTLTYIIASDVTGKHRVRINYPTMGFMSMTDREVEIELEQAIGAELAAAAFTASPEMESPVDQKINRIKARNAERLAALQVDKQETEKTT